MNLVSAGDLINSLEILEEKLVFVKCPFCDEEFTRLRCCPYWQDGKEIKNFVCVECAESVKGLTFMAAHYPLLGIDVIRELFPVYKTNINPRFIGERSYKATVIYGDTKFLVWPKGSRLSVLQNGKSPEDEKTYDNTFQVWFAIRDALLTGNATYESSSWGGKNRRFNHTQKKDIFS